MPLEGTGVGVLVRNFCDAKALGGVAVACLQTAWYFRILCPLLFGGVLGGCEIDGSVVVGTCAFVDIDRHVEVLSE